MTNEPALHPCPGCQKPCRGKRCRRCHGLSRVRAYSRVNAERQRMTVNPAHGATAVQRGSWWLGKPPSDFTALAAVMVVPDDKARPVYKWRDNND